MKHAFPGGQKWTIHIELKREGDRRVRLSISDDGIGFPPHLDFRKTESLGMQIENMLSEQIDARVESSTEGGTRFTVTFQKGQSKKRT